MAVIINKNSDLCLVGLKTQLVQLPLAVREIRESNKMKLSRRPRLTRQT